MGICDFTFSQSHTDSNTDDWPSNHKSFIFWNVYSERISYFQQYLYLFVLYLDRLFHVVLEIKQNYCLNHYFDNYLKNISVFNYCFTFLFMYFIAAKDVNHKWIVTQLIAVFYAICKIDLCNIVKTSNVILLNKLM